MHPPIGLSEKQRIAFLETFKKYAHILMKIDKPESYSTSCTYTYCVILNMTVRVFLTAVFLQSGYQTK
jgi:hypothetical protein